MKGADLTGLRRLGSCNNLKIHTFMKELAFLSNTSLKRTQCEEQADFTNKDPEAPICLKPHGKCGGEPGLCDFTPGPPAAAAHELQKVETSCGCWGDRRHSSEMVSGVDWHGLEGNQNSVLAAISPIFPHVKIVGSWSSQHEETQALLRGTQVWLPAFPNMVLVLMR